MTDTYYIIDYENVHEKGLEGHSRLKNTDHLILFYTDNAKTVSMDLFYDHGESELVVKKVPVGKQSLDIHLISYLGFLIGLYGNQAEYVVVSKDTGYDKVIEFWKQEKKVVVRRIEKINAQNAVNKVKPEKKEPEKKVSEKKEPEKKAPEKKEPVKQIEKKSANKIRLNTEIQQAMSKSKKKWAGPLTAEIAKLASACYQKDDFAERFLHGLMEKWPERQEDIYEIVKPVLMKYDINAEHVEIAAKEVKAENAKQESKPEKVKETADKPDAVMEAPVNENQSVEASKTVAVEENKILSELKKYLAPSNYSEEVINEVYDVIMKTEEAKNRKQQIYLSILQKFGQKQGLAIYNCIKKHI